MFTGLVEGMGSVLAVEPADGRARLTIGTPFPAAELSPGESVAVDGVCLTASSTSASGFTADAVAQTLHLTTLGMLRPGDSVNRARALRIGDRLGGHLVQGHVDATAEVVEVSRQGGDVRLSVALPASLRPYLAPRGSVALSGVSLTVGGVEGGRFWVALVPETLSRTTLGGIAAGRRLNVEVDLLARYLESLLRVRTEGVA